ncbi:MAG: hypothetical protein DMD80_02415 [Candidatus Rokuibacteriota bacterium]|nr:MAG: hypothetical protein DMD80_02415 [Candidatus Rokubacteria bacterium]
MGPFGLEIASVYASQTAVKTLLRSADAWGTCTSDRVKVSRVPKTTSASILFFMCVPPTLTICL